jgi:transcriptional regulator with XRE-family HTH domain
MPNNIDYNNYIEDIFNQIPEWEEHYEELMHLVSEEINKSMIEQDMNKSSFAERMRVSKPYITKLLRGSENISLKTLAKISVALNNKVHIVMRPREWTCHTFAVSPRNVEKRRERYNGFLEQERVSYATV